MKVLLKITYTCGHEDLMAIEADSEKAALEKAEPFAQEVCLPCMDYHCMMYYMLHGNTTPKC